MASRHPRLRALTAFVLILMCVGAIVTAVAPGAHASSVSTAPITAGDGWSAPAWAAREKMLRTDEQALSFAHDLGQAYQASIPLPTPGFFVEQVHVLTVQRYRGEGPTAVWMARFAITVRSSDVTSYSTSYLQTTKYGPGLRPGDVQAVGVQGIMAFADMQPFDTPKRSGFVRYLMAHGNPKPVRVAQLDQHFPGAPWYEDTPVRHAMLETGAQHGMGPGELAWVTYASGHSELLGYETASATWISLRK